MAVPLKNALDRQESWTGGGIDCDACDVFAGKQEVDTVEGIGAGLANHVREAEWHAGQKVRQPDLLIANKDGEAKHIVLMHHRRCQGCGCKADGEGFEY